MRGDKTDNIPGIKGVGDKTAEKLVKDPEALAERMKDPSFREQQERNYSLICLEDLGELMSECEASGIEANWEAMLESFRSFEFRSMTKEKTWDKWVTTFNSLES